jgi:regulator of protease activity HflC (stomatin/prohibitin superfamily)
MFMPPVLVLLVIAALYLLNSIKILAEYERGVVFRLGMLVPAP